MSRLPISRRQFLTSASALATVGVSGPGLGLNEFRFGPSRIETPQAGDPTAVDYTLRIGASPIEIAPKRIISAITYNGQFPGPLLRFKEGQPVSVEIRNDTNTPEQLHWHGQVVSTDVDGAAEEGTP
ncbi:MAG TPA: multicopper oxidase domain-containing protein, partial [Candidatus Acidoferrum sp.]|nr:multicopper oxidase domain-containing protein [Candidatus Acidoferrum sp.]